MIRFIKSFFKKIISEKAIVLIYGLKPEIYKVNIYVLRQGIPYKSLYPIDNKYQLRLLSINDAEKVKEFYPNYKHILPRLQNSAWVGLAFFDSEKDVIAYISWVVVKNIKFINDFNIFLSENQFMVRHGYCNPHYRHKGLHTRMEQERLNYCYSKGANEIYVHIATKNEVGIKTLIDAGYVLNKQNYIFRIPIWGIYRELFSWLRSPFTIID